jgi:glutamate-1-semialdehyde aminotransferase
MDIAYTVTFEAGHDAATVAKAIEAFATTGPVFVAMGVKSIVFADTTTAVTPEALTAKATAACSAAVRSFVRAGVAISSFQAKTAEGQYALGSYYAFYKEF